MATRTPTLDEMPVVRDLEAFDADSGGRLERLVFKHRPVVVAAAALLSLALGWAAAMRHAVNADYRKMMPRGHPFVRNALEHEKALRGLGNTLQIVVEHVEGGVYEPRYLEALRRITDELVLTPGVDRAWVRSLWMPGVRWSEVTEEGFRGGPVMPDDYDGAPAALEALRGNVLRAGIVGTLVAGDERSAAVLVPLLDRDPVTGAGIDYAALAARLDGLRDRFEGGEGGVRLRIRAVGFAVLVAELLAGLRQVTAWFAAAAGIAGAALLLYTRCPRSTALVLACSATAVVWQLGAFAALGIALDPFSVLVPFLVFALGVSHGAQKMNGIMQDVGRGTHRLVAARYTFRRLFAAGLTALLTDGVGFAVLLLVDVPAVGRMALSATLGAGALVVTNLVLLPVLLSYAGVSPRAAARSLRSGEAGGPGRWTWRFLERFTGRRYALGAVAASAAIGAAALLASRHLRAGDVDPGASELRASSRYNRDAAYLAAHYGLSADRFAVIVKTAGEGCLDWRTLVEADRLSWALRQLPAVRSTASLPDAVRRITAGAFEGNPKWLTLSRSQEVLNHAVQQAQARNPELVNAECSVLPVVAYLADHGAATLDQVVRTAESFSRAHGDADRAFLLAAGNAAMEAATNDAVREARWPTLLCAYGAVVLLCLAAFRSWRAVAVTVIPLAFTSLAGEALMALLGVAVKISTLPVIALGVGIPDFALYLLTVQLAHQRRGVPLAEAWRRSLRFTGRVVVFVSVTLAAGVVTWAFSPIRLQADMGILLTFMFLGNMAAALLLVPAFSHFLLADARAVPATAGGAASPAGGSAP